MDDLSVWRKAAELIKDSLSDYSLRDKLQSGDRVDKINLLIERGFTEAEIVILEKDLHLLSPDPRSYVRCWLQGRWKL